MKNEALKHAVGMFPTLKAFAKELSTPERPVTYQMVQQWMVGSVPAEYCPDIERITNGAATCEALNDRVDWAYVRATPNKRYSRRKDARQAKNSTT